MDLNLHPNNSDASAYFIYCFRLCHRPLTFIDLTIKVLINFKKSQCPMILHFNFVKAPSCVHYKSGL